MSAGSTRHSGNTEIRIWCRSVADLVTPDLTTVTLPAFGFGQGLAYTQRGEFRVCSDRHGRPKWLRV